MDYPEMPKNCGWCGEKLGDEALAEVVLIAAPADDGSLIIHASCYNTEYHEIA